jgi:hypothetical protein
LGEKGREFVFKTETTSAWESVLPGELKKLNSATKAQATQMLQVYAKYKNQSGAPDQQATILKNQLQSLQMKNNDLEQKLSLAQQRSSGVTAAASSGPPPDPLRGLDNGH